MSDIMTVEFQDLAQQIATRIDPKTTDYDIYVGLEHLDSDSLRIKRRGTPADVEGEKLLVQKGDIIFGKRRVYQRKVGIADFDGICSAHAMVLRAKEDTIIKELFPFFMQSDEFMNRALQISVGSLSPTINWKTLATQEFSVPNKKDQKRIAALLWAAEDCIDKNARFIEEAEQSKQILMRELFSKGIGHTKFQENDKIGSLPANWEITRLGDISEQFINGGTPSTKNPEFWNGDIEWTTSAPLTGFYVDMGEKRISQAGLENSATNLIPKGNIIIASRVGIGNVVLNRIDIAISQDLTGLIINKSKISPEFLIWYIHSPAINNMLVRSAQGTTIKGITRDKLERIPVVLPPKIEQKKIVDILAECDETNATSRANLATTKALKMKLINQFFSGVDN